MLGQGHIWRGTKEGTQVNKRQKKKNEKKAAEQISHMNKTIKEYLPRGRKRTR